MQEPEVLLRSQLISFSLLTVLIICWLGTAWKAKSAVCGLEYYVLICLWTFWNSNNTHLILYWRLLFCIDRLKLNQRQVNTHTQVYFVIEVKVHRVKLVLGSFQFKNKIKITHFTSSIFRSQIHYAILIVH